MRSMPDPYPPSEFGGKTNDLGIQPSPHVPTSAEKLSLIYRTGDPEGSGLIPADDGEAFSGLLPADVQRAIREQAGHLDKGQVWEQMLQEDGGG